MNLPLLSLLFSILAFTFQVSAEEKSYGPLVFSYLKAGGANHIGEYPKTGIEVYLKQSTDSLNAGAYVTIIEYRYGTEPKTDRAYLWYDDIPNKLKSIDFKPFDWESEVTLAEERRRATENSMILNIDGFKYSLHYSFEGTTFDLEGSNIGSSIEIYAPYSEKISKLRDVTEEFYTLFGKLRML